MSDRDALVIALARACGVPEAIIRIEFPDDDEVHPCAACGHPWKSREAALACATYDDTRD